jgi:hypothetical protein
MYNIAVYDVQRIYYNKLRLQVCVKIFVLAAQNATYNFSAIAMTQDSLVNDVWLQEAG